MIIKLFAFTPEIFLFFAMPVMLLVGHYRENVTPKTFFTLAKIFLLFAAVGGILFYDYNGYSEWWINNSYTSLAKISTILFALAWFFLSCKWFLNKNRSSQKYYFWGMGSVFTLMFVISSQNLGVMCGALLLYFLLNVQMIKLCDDDFDISSVVVRYRIFSLLFFLMFALGCGMVYHKIGSLDYTKVGEYLNTLQVISLYEVASAVFIIVPLLYMIGLAPFHFWFAEVLAVCTLPVCGFLTMVPIFAGYSALADLCLNVFYPLQGYLKPTLMLFSVLSLLIGALSANNEQNLRRLFAFSALCHLGIVFLVLTPFNYNSLSASFAYLLFYISSTLGVYTVFFGFKSKGEYLEELDEISGIFAQRPYISTAMLVFLVSLTGCPPMLGFLGKLLAVNSMIIEGSYWGVAILMFSLLMLAKAYLEIIKAAFFNERTRSFDRVDNGIYICLFINIIIVLLAILNPGRVLSYLDGFLSVVL